MPNTVFVVDDNGTNLSMAEEALEKEYRVITMSSAPRMFTILEKVSPDLILLDIEMPEMDGFEALKRLKAAESYAQIPVIFMTASDDAAAAERGKELGAADFITKPFSEPALLDSVRKHLRT